MQVGQKVRSGLGALYPNEVFEQPSVYRIQPQTQMTCYKLQSTNTQGKNTHMKVVSNSDISKTLEEQQGDGRRDS